MSNASRAASLKRTMRRLARPILSPIDGRVADINRRIDGAVTATDVYVRSTAEVSSYVGVELRRIHDLVASFADTSLEEYYKMRLGQAATLPLSELDESLARAVTIEVPFAMGGLGRLRPGSRILDLGSTGTTFALSAAALGYQVESLEDWETSSEPFAAVFLISMAERFPLLDRVRVRLRSGGLLVLTAPYDARDRIDPPAIDHLRSLLADWEILERRVALQRDVLVWEPREDVEPGSRGVVMMIASPKRDTGPASSSSQ